jgi:hypothetical protein
LAGRHRGIRTVQETLFLLYLRPRVFIIGSVWDMKFSWLWTYLLWRVVLCVVASISEERTASISNLTVRHGVTTQYITMDSNFWDLVASSSVLGCITRRRTNWCLHVYVQFCFIPARTVKLNCIARCDTFRTDISGARSCSSDLTASCYHCVASKHNETDVTISERVTTLHFTALIWWFRFSVWATFPYPQHTCSKSPLFRSGTVSLHFSYRQLATSRYFLVHQCCMLPVSELSLCSWINWAS